MATFVYIAIKLIVPPGQPPQVLDVIEFETDSWEENFKAATEWVLKNRKPTCNYKIYS